jgi:2-polyprenyl-3-methyl-5-hydroxy-6-metoxy-1,4-benzoquinol methylase
MSKISFEPPLYVQRKMFISTCLLELSQQFKIKKILDIGCGEGNLLKYLKEDNYSFLDGLG